MNYIAYLIILLALYAGYAPWHPGVILPFALASTLIFIQPRRKALKEEVHRQGGNLALDGAFLFFVQVLIMFLAYGIGYFLHYRVKVGA